MKTGRARNARARVSLIVPDQSLDFPLRFEPIFQYRLWGGRKLADISSWPLPDGPIGEAWLLSDRDDFPSRVVDGPWRGKTIAELIQESPADLLGEFASRYTRFPLLLKFLDAREMLSVQVHPSDEMKQYLPPGELGKTEAWVVLETEPGSKIYAGLTKGTTEADVRALNADNADRYLAHFHPQVGDGVMIVAGTVHALGGGVVVFEVQQNSDVTFRLFDWDRVDPTTGKRRTLTVDESVACTNFAFGPVSPVVPQVESTDPALSELMLENAFFWLRRKRGSAPFPVGAKGFPRVLVCTGGSGQLSTFTPFVSASAPIRKGDVFMLPAALDACAIHPDSPITILEIGLPGDKP